jgi:hypothetical protein
VVAAEHGLDPGRRPIAELRPGRFHLGAAS